MTVKKIIPGFFAMAALASCDSPEDVGGCRFPAEGAYGLVWSDEFDGNQLDTAKWGFDLGDGCDQGVGDELCGWGNNELQTYTKRPENVYLEDGKLVIKAIRESPLFEGKYPYTSARLKTKDKGDWRFGKMEIRAKLPIGQGLWPAIWMLPTESVYGRWPKSGEIDIMEATGDKSDQVFGTIHWGHDRHYFNEQRITKTDSIFYSEFHTYTAVWTDDCILFQVDGEDIGVPNNRTTTLPSTWPFDQFFHIILNIAVGGNLPGDPDQSTQFPQTMEVDFVRVYQTE